MGLNKFWNQVTKSIKDIGRPVLSDRKIRKYIEKGLLFEGGDINDAQIQPNSVDLTLGNTYKSINKNSRDFFNGCVDPSKPITYQEGHFESSDNKLYESKLIPKGKEFIIVQPNEFVLLASNEILNIPNGIIGFVQGRSSIARMGIQTEQAGLIDAGFRGTITFEVFNQTKYPIILYEGMRIAQAYFFKAQHADILYGQIGANSKYHGQIIAQGSKIYLDEELMESGASDKVSEFR